MNLSETQAEILELLDETIHDDAAVVEKAEQHFDDIEDESMEFGVNQYGFDDADFLALADFNEPLRVSFSSTSNELMYTIMGVTKNPFGFTFRVLVEVADGTEADAEEYIEDMLVSPTD